MTLMAVFAPSAHKIIGGKPFLKKNHHFILFQFFFGQHKMKIAAKTRIKVGYNCSL